MAIAGFEVYNADGTLRNSVTDQLGRIIGQSDHSGWGTFAWPYPNIPGKRAVYCISNLAPTDNVFSCAYAFIRPDDGLIWYDQAGDRRPITILYMVY